MKPNTDIAEHERRKKRRADYWLRLWLNDLRRRQMKGKRHRRRKWLLALMLIIFGQIARPFAMTPPQPLPAPSLKPRPLMKKPTRRKAFDLQEHVDRDYAPRTGEQAEELFDGLTSRDISQIRYEARPVIPGLPERYGKEWPHLFTLLDHLQYPFARQDAITVIKKMVSPAIHDWIDSSVEEDGGKAIRRCRSKSPEETLAAMPRAASQWREQLRRDAEQRRLDAEEEQKNSSKPPNGPQGNL
ncbi:hypothetical protein [Rhizobium tubonense]|uniref:Uncharacterized protein n=1 Tax=Rhizobium tubonense TaxID=484088 RepID=A0A2W4CGF7_9HYPH|nr:hypothetical protein [Rhizobium tubonense]PZM10168.1 hypothetical protein CPY51_23705 [Rhizobium tubonense]